MGGGWVGWAGCWLPASLHGVPAPRAAPGLGRRPASTQYLGLSLLACLLSRDPDLALLSGFWFFVWREAPPPGALPWPFWFCRFPASGFCCGHVEARARGFLPWAAFPGAPGITPPHPRCVRGYILHPPQAFPCQVTPSFVLHPCVPGTGSDTWDRAGSKAGMVSVLPRGIILGGEAAVSQIFPPN